MSFFSIKDFIASGMKAIEDKNYWSGLAVALMLPSMCSRIAFAGEKDKYMNSKWKDKNDHSKGRTYTTWKDAECYVDFCKLCFCKDGWLCACLGEHYAEVLYQLRCDIVHAGVASIYADDKGLYLELGDVRGVTDFSKYRVISIKSLCSSVFSHISIWCDNYGAENFKYTRVFDMEKNRDDRLLYNRLCDEDRADYLYEQFMKEQSGER